MLALCDISIVTDNTIIAEVEDPINDNGVHVLSLVQSTYTPEAL